MTACRRRSALVPMVLGAVLLAGTGCGAEESTVEVSPLSARLAQIDESLASKRFEQARRDLAALAAATKASRSAGEVSATRADAILDAIIALRTTLPTPKPAPAPKPTPTPTPTPTVAAPPAQPSAPTTTTTTTTKPDGDQGSGGKGKPDGKGRKPNRS